MALIDNLVSYYKLDENAANTDVDDAHASNDGTASTNTNNLYDASGKINSCFDFQEENDELVNLGDATWDSVFAGNFSISVWFKTNTLTIPQGIVTKWWDGSTRVVALGTGGIGGGTLTRLGVRYEKGGSTGQLESAESAISTGTWYHAVITKDGSGIKLYLDGDEVATTSDTFATSNNALAYIGNGYFTDSPIYPFDGLIDEVAIFDANIGPGGVTSLYNSGAGLAYPFAVSGVSVSDTATLTDTLSISEVEIPGVSVSDTTTLTDTLSISKTGPGLVVGTNCGLVETAPSVDPGEDQRYTIDNYGRAVRIIVGATPITITEIGWWCDTATEASNFEVGIYSDSADVPGSLLEVDRTNAKGTTAGWKKQSGLSWDLSANTTYWLAVQLDNTTTTTYIDYANIGGQRYSYNTSMATLPDTWSATGTSDNIMMAIYGVYEETEVQGVSVSDTATLTDTFSIFASEQFISVSDITTLTDDISISILVPVPEGTADKDTLWINDSGTWREFPYFDFFKVNKKQNQMSEFEVQLYDISTAQKDYFKEQAEVLFFCGESMVLKGRIQTIEYKSAYEVLAQGYGMEVRLLDKQFIVSGENRIQYDNQSAKDIITAINSNILTTTSGIFQTDYGNISMRYEYANRLNALGKTADAIDYYWWVSQTSTDTYSANYLNVADNQGSTSSVKTFDLSNNATIIEQNRDTTNLINYVHALGYGDGINQLSTYQYAASTQSSFLSSNITATNSTISCSSIPFNSTGSVRIAKEIIAYSGTSSTALTGCTRGTSSTTASAHNKNCYIEQYYTTGSAQTGSSIQTYGLKDHTLIDKTIINEETLEVVASGYLSDRKEPIQIIKVQSDEPLTDAVLNMGDNVTITSSEANIDGSYRIVSQEFTDNYGSLEMNTEVSNRSLEFIEAMQKSREESESQAKYMQGATNLYAINEAENCDAANYVNLRFFMPSEAVAVNAVKLSFTLEDYRAYESANANESSHTHGFAAISDTNTDNDISGTTSTSTWEDTGGSVNVNVKSGEKVLVMYSMGIDPQGDPPLGEMDLRIQRDVGGGGYSTLNESISYWVPGEGPSQTKYWSYPGSGMVSFNPATDDNLIDLDNGTATPNSGTLWYGCPVTLPHGAVITGAIVYATGTNVTWRLYRDAHVRTGSPTLMASANTDTEDTSITSATIDNSGYSYWFEVGSLTSATIIDSVRITYTYGGGVGGDISIYNNTLSKVILDSPSAGSVTYKLQVDGTSGDEYGSLGSGTLTAIVFNNSSTTETGSAHTHGITYGIHEETLTSPSVDVYIGEDGGSMTKKGTYTSDQSDLDITSLVSAIGTDKWINIQFRPNKEMRIEANSYCQIFLESK